MKSSTVQVNFYRQKVLLAVLQAFGGTLSNIELQKYLFLFTRLCQKDKSYEFVPFKYGCFSFQSYADRRKLADLGAISANPDIWHLVSTDNYLDTLTRDDKDKLIVFSGKYSVIKGKKLLKEVYTRFPYFAIRSEIAGDLMSETELAEIERVRPSQKAARFFTIGYEGKSFEQYLNQLIENNVHVLCDVRKNPLSRKFGFSKKMLAVTLESLGIHYMHLPDLGITSDKRKVLKTPLDYYRLFDGYEATTLRTNTEALQQLFSTVKKYKRVAITCFEADVCMCHRGRVAKALQKLPEWTYKIEHL